MDHLLVCFPFGAFEVFDYREVLEHKGHLLSHLRHAPNRKKVPMEADVHHLQKLAQKAKNDGEIRGLAVFQELENDAEEHLFDRFYEFDR